MRDHDCRASVVVAALILLQGRAATSRPGRPRRRPRPTRPSRRPATRSTARRSTTARGTHAYLMPGMGKVHFPVTTEQARGPGVHRPGGRPAPLVLSTSRPSGRSARPPSSTPTAPWPTGAWPWPTSTTPSGPRGSSRRPASATPSSIPPRDSSTSTRSRRFYKEGGDDKDRASRTTCSGLETIVQEFPDDIDARAWLAMVTWQNATDGIGSRQAVDTVIDTVLQVEPMHPGAHHYRIHLWDGTKPIRAEKSAGALRQDRAGDRPRLAHARPHLHRAEALRRRRLPAGRLGPRRPRLHDPRPGHAVRDPQLRPQQPVALHQPAATSAGSATRSPWRGTWSSSPATRRRTARTTAARRSGAAGSAGPRS